MKAFVAVVFTVSSLLACPFASAMHCDDAPADSGEQDVGTCRHIPRGELGAKEYCYNPDGFDVITLKKNAVGWESKQPVKLKWEAPTGNASSTTQQCEYPIDGLFDSDNQPYEVDLSIAKKNDGKYVAWIPNILPSGGIKVSPQPNADEFVWLQSDAPFAYTDRTGVTRHLNLYIFLRNSRNSVGSNMPKYYYVVAVDNDDPKCMTANAPKEKTTVDAKMCGQKSQLNLRQTPTGRGSFQQTGVGGGGEGD